MFKNVEYESPAGRRYSLILIGLAGVVASVMLPNRTAYAIEANDRAVVTQVIAKHQSRDKRMVQTAAALRDLWIDHIFWVRNVSLAAINNNEAATKAADQQAIANAQLIAASIEPFYGTAAKEAFFQLLAGHYGAIKAYLKATVSNDTSAQATAARSLTSNAEEIATFLSKANPYLPKEALNSLLLAHGGHHIQQVQELRARNYVSEAKNWKIMKGHVYQIADTTADALRKQFPGKF